jgi:hypothetical protein
MTQPRVCAVMLVDGRPEMVARAIRSFEAQTYPVADRLLFLYNSGSPFPEPASDSLIAILRRPKDTIGAMRNAAIREIPKGYADIIVHWDSDDWSAPERIAEQVALLTNPTRWHTALEAVGYSDMLFWDTRTNEAWLYTGSPAYMCGTSLCYWRDTWKRKPFPAVNQGEDTAWQMGLQSLSVRSFNGTQAVGHNLPRPRMVCSIHGGNISSHVDQRSQQWRRVPKWDEWCRGVMA